MIILRCRRCSGTGLIQNEQYQICQSLSSPETKRYFPLPTEDQVGEDEDRQHDACRNVPEYIECPVCDGAGMIAFDDEDWEIRIVADEDAGMEA
jgi:hypothetical protein